MKLIILGILYISPVIALNYLVMPELAKLEDFYGNIDATANHAAGIDTDLHQTTSKSYTTER